MSLRKKLLHNEITYVTGYTIHKVIRVLAIRMFRLFCRQDPKKVVFASFEGRTYNDNPRYLSEKLREMCPEANIVWMMRKGAMATPEGVVRTRFNSMESFRHMATARVWVSNYYMYSYYPLDTKRQYYVNTWHGDRGFKRVGFDNPLARCHQWGLLESKCAFMLSGSDFGSRVIHTGSHCAEAYCVGYPRNDVLVNGDPALAASVRNRLGIDPDAKVLLYAPTFRDKDSLKGKLQQPALDLEKTLACLEKKTGEKWICLYRTHHLSSGVRLENQDRFMNVTSWPEMTEILLISDLLITDYSSCGGDFVLQKRPAIYFQDDIARYEDTNRELYFDMNECPFMIAHTQAELEAILRDLTPEKVAENCLAIKEFFGEKETGRAAELTARRIMKYLGEEGKA